jgi:hypothetical protein
MANQQAFWSAWKGGGVRFDLLDALRIRYIAVSRREEPVPLRLPSRVVPVYSNAEFTVLRVK